MSSRRAGSLARAVDQLSDRSIIIVGGKGGVGKTTIAAATALRISSDRDVVLFSTDPATSLPDLLDPADSPFRIESLDAESEWNGFLDTSLEPIVTLIERGTIFDEEEIRQLITRSIPGIDEIMGWRKIFTLYRNLGSDGALVIDTAPTGHTLRLLDARSHYDAFTSALEAMSEKHREIVFQLAGADVDDSAETWLDELRSSIEEEASILSDPSLTTFLPVTLGEDLVVDQTLRLVDSVESLGLDVPFVVLNRVTGDCDCQSCREARAGEDAARGKLEAKARIVTVERLCRPVARLADLEELLAARRGVEPEKPAKSMRGSKALDPEGRRLVFVAGKGGTGKTSTATSIGLQLAVRNDGEIHLLSVDPARSLTDLTDGLDLPDNLHVEQVDPSRAWKDLEDEMEKTLDELFGAPDGRFRAVHDERIARSLLDIAPPGADEIFALMRIVELLRSGAERIVVDTAPTGHFLRLIDLPELATSWVRQLMKILLEYWQIMPAGSLGSTLLEMSKGLRELEEVLVSEQCGVVIVTRPEPMVIAETKRLADELAKRKIGLIGIVANYLTPQNECPCDRARRAAEIRLLEDFPDVTMVERIDPEPGTIEVLESLVPLPAGPAGH
ncbi:MAG: hypothetical protein KY459_02300 [Acidobacteria bacterium]|nr:hypothetical protein [Acidobacteriota bacterium]